MFIRPRVAACRRRTIILSACVTENRRIGNEGGRQAAVDLRVGRRRFGMRGQGAGQALCRALAVRSVTHAEARRSG